MEERPPIWRVAANKLNKQSRTADEDGSPAYQNIKSSAKESLGLHEWKEHKPWLDTECLEFLDQRKQAKMQWI